MSDFVADQHIAWVGGGFQACSHIDGNTFEVSGNLTLHGVTKPVTAMVEKVGSGKDPRSGKTLVGFEAKFTIKRSDFDMKYQVGPLSDEVDVHIALHAVAR